RWLWLKDQDALRQTRRQHLQIQASERVYAHGLKVGHVGPKRSAHVECAERGRGLRLRTTRAMTKRSAGRKLGRDRRIECREVRAHRRGARRADILEGLEGQRQAGGTGR